MLGLVIIDSMWYGWPTMVVITGAGGGRGCRWGGGGRGRGRRWQAKK